MTHDEKRAKAALLLAKKLDAARTAMTDFTNACVLSGERYPNADDTRRTLASLMGEYAGYLERVYQK
jgi:hypothetical protein